MVKIEEFYEKKTHETKTETSQQAQQANIKDHYQGIRDRKPNKPINQDHQSSSFSPPLTTENYYVKNIENIFYQFCNKFSLRPRNAIIGMIFLTIVTIYLMSRNTNPPSSFFKNFADTANNIFEDVNRIELPAANTVMEHTVACRRAANMIQRSPAFKSYGVQIAKGLREFGEKIREAGHLLQKMYSKGSSVYHSFDVEIEAMMNRLNSDYIRQGDAKYFKERLNKLITKIREFRELVGKTHSSIHDAENIRHDTEGYLFDGLREAEKFIVNDRCHSVDVVKAKNELEAVNDILDHLHNTAVHLDKMEKILKVYEGKLLDVSAELDSAGKGDDGIFEVTKADLKFLKLAVDNSKSSLYKFNMQAQIN